MDNNNQEFNEEQIKQSVERLGKMLVNVTKQGNPAEMGLSKEVAMRLINAVHQSKRTKKGRIVI
ncbi:hypothetical protein [Paenibacillus taichungensis]